jgi:hypothetical protein
VEVVAEIAVDATASVPASAAKLRDIRILQNRRPEKGGGFHLSMTPQHEVLTRNGVESQCQRTLRDTVHLTDNNRHFTKTGRRM